MIRLFVGLGNPGTEYEDTRHNAGFWYIDQLARRLNVNLVMDRAYHGFVGRANLPGGPVWLLQPQTYMNLSGKSVASLARFFKIAPENILVAHDELDMLPGQVKLKQGGGHAGHNGLRDTHAQLGSPNYWRLRLGIGHPGVKSEVAAYVLRKPPLSERELIEQSIDKALSATDALLSGDMAKATAAIHAGAQRPKPPPPDVPSPPGAFRPQRLSTPQPALARGAAHEHPGQHRIHHTSGRFHDTTPHGAGGGHHGLAGRRAVPHQHIQRACQHGLPLRHALSGPALQRSG